MVALYDRFVIDGKLNDPHRHIEGSDNRAVDLLRDRLSVGAEIGRIEFVYLADQPQGMRHRGAYLYADSGRLLPWPAHCVDRAQLWSDQDSDRGVLMAEQVAKLCGIPDDLFRSMQERSRGLANKSHVMLALCVGGEWTFVVESA